MFFFLLLIPGDALAATVHGTVYEWYSFKPLENAVVEVNSTPEQYFVASDAVYSFNLTPGSYLITASYFEGGTVVYAAEEAVTITENGDYVLDLLLFPTYEEELLDQSEFADFDQDFEETELVTEESSRNGIYAFILLALCALLLAGYFWKKGPRKPLDMPDNLQKSSGGRSGAQPGFSVNEHKSGTESENFEEQGKNSGTFKEFPKQGSDSPALQAVEEEAQRSETNVQGPGAEPLKKGISGDKVLKEGLPESEGLKEGFPEYEWLKEGFKEDEGLKEGFNEDEGLKDGFQGDEGLKEGLLEDERLKEGFPVKEVLGGDVPEGDVPENEVLKVDDLEEKDPGKEMSKDGAGEVLREPGVAVLPSISEEPVEPSPEIPEDPEAHLPEDLTEILELIRASGNRITQLELRKKSRYSESKVSLMLSDLEERGLIEKFKKGRGNIIRIPDEHVIKEDANKKNNEDESS